MDQGAGGKPSGKHPPGEEAPRGAPGAPAAARGPSLRTVLDESLPAALQDAEPVVAAPDSEARLDPSGPVALQATVHVAADRVTAPPPAAPGKEAPPLRRSVLPRGPSERTVLDDGLPSSLAGVRAPAPTAPDATGPRGPTARTVLDDGPTRFGLAPSDAGAVPTTSAAPSPLAASPTPGTVAYGDRGTPGPGAPPAGATAPPGTRAWVPPSARTDGRPPHTPTRAAASASAGGAEPEPEAPTYAEGDRIQQYELIRELGRGGMGQVFLARDLKLGRKVAIKFLNTPSPRFTERFLVEARATARCSHENIVVIHEVNEYRDQPFMVLEFLEGEPLSALTSGNRMPATRAVELLVPVVRALVRAHEFNIIHRDLKPDNIVVQRSGAIKVLDFGIAKLYTGGDDDGTAGTGGATRGAPAVAGLGPEELAALRPGEGTRDGAIVGTMAYMSPEQWGAAPVDHRTDIWAVGLILYELVAGEHPLAGLTPQQIMMEAARLDQPLPSVGQAVPDLPGDLERIIDRCLAKDKEQRFGSAQALLDALEPLLPTQYGRKLTEDDSPYPGLTAFQEADAGRFFGRSQDILRAVARIRDQPLLGVVGPSGVGKSSFIRAGVVPSLKASGEAWETFIVRPGRHPLQALASLLQPLTRSSSLDHHGLQEHAALHERLRTEPGYLGTLLRERARQKNAHILLFVDQFEELYTLVPDEAERKAYTACLAGVADDTATPLRVVVSMRSDFLDRAAEDQRFMEELSRGLVFLQSPDRDGLREAIVSPLEMVGYRFDNPAVVEEMLDTLANTPGALPLLQFTAATLWESRDRRTHQLSEAAFRTMGGVAGALATHADEVLQRLSASDQRLVRAVLLRLVTSEGTRAIVDVVELAGLTDTPGEVRRLVDHLVTARLLVVQSRGDAEGPAVELVHESLISGWPRLRRWLDEGHEDTAYLEQLRGAARQWEAKSRPQGLLWRGDAMEEARLWRRRYQGELSRLEAEYLDAVFALATRATRRNRAILTGVIVLLAALVVAGAVALVSIRRAEQAAKRNESQARAAEQKVTRQLELIRQKEREKQAAEQAANQAQRQVATKDKDLKQKQVELNLSYDQLKDALKKAQQEKAKAETEQERAEKATLRTREALKKAQAATDRAQQAAEAERKAKTKIEQMLQKERARVQRLLKERRKITTELK